MKIKLYKIKNGNLILVDYGILAKLESYGRQGYIVEIEKVDCKKRKDLCINL
jgi:hypothetical protein